MNLIALLSVCVNNNAYINIIERKIMLTLLDDHIADDGTAGKDGAAQGRDAGADTAHI